MKKIEIDDETADRIVVCSLKDSIAQLKADIKKFKMIKNPSDWELNELSEYISDLDALEKTYEYYGGNIK